MQIGEWISRCDNSGGSCVEVMDTGNSVVVRDAHGGQVAYDYAEWDSFLAGAADGRFNRTASR